MTSATATTMTWELWRTAEGTTVFFAQDNAEARAALGSDAAWLWSVEAETFEDALARRDAAESSESARLPLR